MKTAFLLFLIVNVSFLSAQHNTYYVGHSGFGWDLIVGEMVNDLAADANISTYDYGFQFIGGTCLANQWFSHDDPQGGTDSRAEIATGNYDIVVLAEQIPIQEVLLGSIFCNENVITSYQSLDNFYDLANGASSATQVYLMEFHNEVDQTSLTPYEDWIALNAEMRPIWEHVADSVSQINSGPAVRIVPVAAAYQAMADSVRAGVFPGITTWIDIFDPNDVPEATIHPTEMTYYLSACVHYSTIFGQSPAGLTNETFAAAGWQFDPPSEEQAQMMQEIAWEIVSNDLYAQTQSVTGLEPKLEVKLEVFPNPFMGNFTLSLNGTVLKNAELMIFNLSGDELMHLSQLSGNEFNVDCESLIDGIYFFNLIDESNQQFNGRLIAK